MENGERPSCPMSHMSLNAVIEPGKLLGDETAERATDMTAYVANNVFGFHNSEVKAR